ncbi:hypothetical protein BDN70DRAFT_881731 [Pholiota conissans]|uniref:Uncharacterized protein n=1 Tax=Pholiota conissans TaxID=109636 RepID=A0A9P5YXL7_9AGAR|nr:hypothetical protein BDN70DRAFT_881731 [Pholiota conissans]
MALQTQTHTETSITDTPTATPPPPPPPPAHGPNTNFSAAGSPPLILAFLAVGLFSAAMIVVFGWRRFGYGRFTIGGLPRTPSMQHRSGESGKAPFVLPKKPKLWEAWNADEVTWAEVSGRSEEGREVGGYRDGQWANMMPLSASAVLSDARGDDSTRNTLRHAPDSSSPPAPLAADQLMHAFVGLRPFTRRRSPAQSEPITTETTPEKESYEPKSTRTSIAPSRTLQVGVAILLPSPEYPIYIRDRERTNHTGYPQEKTSPRRRKEPPDYSIGLYDCSWE